MKFLSALFNRPQTIDVPTGDLALIVMPFLPENRAVTNVAIAHGFEETAEWLRIGFDAETNKGSMYHALHYALRRIADTVRAAPDSKTVAIKREWLEAIKAGAPQLVEASRNLDAMTRQKANYQPTYVQDRQGNMLEVPFTQIYNRPGAAHDLMGMKLEDVYANLEVWLGEQAIKPASGRTLESYVPQRR